MKEKISVFFRKRLLAGIAFFCIFLTVLTGCAGKEVEPEMQTEPTIQTETKMSAQGIDVVVYAYLFRDKTENEICSEVEENGYLGYTINDDGSVTFTMTEEKYQEKLDGFRSSFFANAEEIMALENGPESYRSIECDDTLTKVDIIVDSGEFRYSDVMYGQTFLEDSAYYQAFPGIPAERFDLFVNYIDMDSGEVLRQSSFRENVNKSAEPEETTAATEVLPTTAELGETYTVDGVCNFTITGYELTSKITRNGMQLMFGKLAKTNDSTILLLVKANYTNLGTETADRFSLIEDASLTYRGHTLMKVPVQAGMMHSRWQRLKPILFSISRKRLPSPENRWSLPGQSAERHLSIQFCFLGSKKTAREFLIRKNEKRAGTGPLFFCGESFPAISPVLSCK